MNSSTPLPEIDAKTPVSPSKEPALGTGRVEYLALWCILIAAVVGCNAAIAPLADRFGPRSLGAPLVCFCFGVILAQGGLLSAYIVWSGRPFYVRLTAHWLTAAMLYGIYQVGTLLDDSPLPAAIVRRDAVFFWCALPCHALFAQMPLWGSRLFWNWSIVRDLGNDLRSSARAWGIADFLVGMTLVALSFTLLRSAVGNDGSLWTAVFVGSISVAAASAIVLLPTAWLVLGKSRLISGLLWLLVYYSFLVAVGLAAIYAITHFQHMKPPDLLSWDALLVATVVVGITGTAICAFTLLRVSGYRLHGGRRARSPLEPAKLTA